MTALFAILPVLQVLAAVATDRVPELERPIVLRWTDSYLDGGTVGVQLVGSAGQQIRGGFGPGSQEWDGCMQPWYVYVGADHYRHTGAQQLPLWGDEEARFVAMIEDAIVDSLGHETVSFLATNRLHRNLPDSLTIEIWRLAQQVVWRKEQLEAVQTGSLASPAAFFRHSGYTPPLSIGSIKQQNDVITTELVDGDGRSLWIDAGGDLGRCGWRFAHHSTRDRPYETDFGCWETFDLLTALEVALTDTQLQRLGPEELDCARAVLERSRECRLETLKYLRGRAGER